MHPVISIKKTQTLADIESRRSLDFLFLFFSLVRRFPFQRAERWDEVEAILRLTYELLIGDRWWFNGLGIMTMTIWPSKWRKMKDERRWGRSKKCDWWWLRMITRRYFHAGWKIMRIKCIYIYIWNNIIDNNVIIESMIIGLSRSM